MHDRKAFTLIELLVVIAIIAILSVVVILVLNPAQLLMQSRDANRFSDMASINDVLGIYLTNSATGSLGTPSTTYVSIPDPVATSTSGDQCQGLNLPPLPIGDGYHCSGTSTYKGVDGTGWIPVTFSSLSTGAPLGSLPSDPTNTTSSGYFYTYTPSANGTQYELTSIFESQKYIPSMANDGGAYDGIYQIGTDFNITPSFRSYGLVGYWPLDEGSGTVAYDFSGSNNNGSWVGTKASPSSTYYTTGIVFSYAGYFDGSTNYASYGTNLSTFQFGTGSFSISAWFNASNSGGAIGSPALLGVVAGSNGARYALDYDEPSASVPNSLTMFIKDRSGNSVTKSLTANAITENTWYDAVMVVNQGSASISLYLNGALVTSTSISAVTGSLSSSGAAITGTVVNGVTPNFQGSIDDVRVYNRALSGAEIQALYNAAD